MNQLCKGLERINSINWGTSGRTDEPSNMALLQEYIRRAAILTTTYRLKTSYPFFNASRAFGYDVDMDITEKCPQLKRQKNDFLKGMCEAYLEWLLLFDSGNEIALEFHDLYEPLILLIERGGTIRRKHGEIITGGYAFPLAHAEYMSKQAPIDISDEGLEAWTHQ